MAIIKLFYYAYNLSTKAYNKVICKNWEQQSKTTSYL